MFIQPELQAHSLHLGAGSTFTSLHRIQSLSMGSWFWLSSAFVLPTHVCVCWGGGIYCLFSLHCLIWKSSWLFQGAFYPEHLSWWRGLGFSYSEIGHIPLNLGSPNQNWHQLLHNTSQQPGKAFVLSWHKLAPGWTFRHPMASDGKMKLK